MTPLINPHMAEAGTLLSVLAFFLMVRAQTARQYLTAWLVQLFAQPFWLASTWIASQYFMFGVSVVFLFIAMHGVMRFWLTTRDEDRRTYGTN